MEGKITSEDVWMLLGVRPAQRSQQNMELLGDAMKQLGWERKRLRVGHSERAYMYVKGPEPYPLIRVAPGEHGAPAYPYYAFNRVIGPSY